MTSPRPPGWRLLARAVAILAAPALLGLTPLSANAATYTLAVTSSSQYRDSINYWHIVGEVHNPTSTTVWVPQLSLDLYSASNTLIGSTVATTDVEYMGPGERSPFSYLVSPSTYPSYDHYIITGVTAATAPRRANHNFTSAITSVTTDWVGYTHIVGTVTNNNAVSCDYVFIYFTFYSASGQVVDDGLTSPTSSSTVAPGQTSSFELLRSPDRPAYSAYQVMVESSTPPVVTVPSAPTSVVAGPGDQQASVRWSPPSSDGNADISGYTVTASPGGQSISVAGTQTTATVLSLANGTAYTFTVTASNSAGPGGPSAPSNSVIPAGRPLAPAAATATPGDSSVLVAWTAGSNNGSPIQSYVVTVLPGGRSVAVPAATTHVVIPGLSNGSSYSFGVAAVNAIGTGPTTTAGPATPLGRLTGGGSLSPIPVPRAPGISSGTAPVAASAPRIQPAAPAAGQPPATAARQPAAVASTSTMWQASLSPASVAPPGSAPDPESPRALMGGPMVGLVA